MSNTGTSAVTARAASEASRRVEDPRRRASVRWGPVSFRLNLRTLLVAVAALGALTVLAAWSITLGSFPVPFRGVIAAALGSGTQEHDFIVRTLRMPRMFAAILVGASLAMSGAIFQGLVRNPLVSPDIIGITQGASVAAVAWIVLLQPPHLLAPVAFAGAVVTAVAVYTLSWRGGIAPNRLVLIGIGVNAALVATMTYLLVRFPIERVGSAVAWAAGSVYASSWDDVWLLAATLAVLTPVAAVLMWHLRLLQFGDDTAHSLGLAVEPTRLALVALGCAFAAIAVSLAGPIGFVALMVPHVARMIAGPMTGSVLVLTAVLGSILLLGADVVGQHFLPVSMPVGVVTAVVGAPYFLFLLYRANTRL